VQRLEAKLSNQGFVAKAPAAVVEGERAKLASAQEKLAATKAALAKLG
jgi:valyl-tRNA synthetase